MTLSLGAVSLARGGRTLLTDVSATCRPGSITVLAGPNGAGKSTLLLAIAGELALVAGDVTIEGSAVAKLPLAERARRRAFLQQASSVAFDFLVPDVVAMGLHPHGLSPHHGRGVALIDAAIDDFELAAMRDCPVTRLSGGEQQRVHLARTFVQARACAAPGLLLLDEPMTGLDYRHQFALAGLLRREAARDVIVVLSLHDLVMAERIADQLLLLNDGRLIAAGSPLDLVRPDRIAAVFGLTRCEAEVLLAGPSPLREAAE